MSSTFGSKPRGRAVLAAVAAGAGLLLAGAPAASASTTGTSTDFLIYGNDGSSYVTGSVFFYNRSAEVVASLHAVGCRRVYAYAYAGTKLLDTRSSSTHCNSDTGQDIPLNADVVGGADHVKIKLTDQYGVAVGPIADIGRP